MKKYIFLFPLTILIILFYSSVSVKADTVENTKTVYAIDWGNGDIQLFGFIDSTVYLTPYPNMNSWFLLNGTWSGYAQPSYSFHNTTIADVMNYYLTECTGFGYSGSANPSYPFNEVQHLYVLRGEIISEDPRIEPERYWPVSPDPPEPEPGSSWLSDLWEWVLWQLGLNDDYSGDIDAYITGGDRERMEMVTPSPTPSPTPVPSPTPYSLDIVDNNGNPVYTITGIPGSTYNINNTTNNNDGSDFDIFEVDLKIGDGGSTNPRDGLNDVMDSSLTYLSDSENVDMQPVGDSFSIIPNDWFLLLGVVACFPFIAGFISKLLK